MQSIKYSEETSFNENFRSPPKKKISNYLPVSLLKDLSFDDDDYCEEITEVVSSIKIRQPVNKSNFKRRRSSSLDFGILSNVNHVKFAVDVEKDKTNGFKNQIFIQQYPNHQDSSSMSQPKTLLQPRTKRSENITERQANNNNNPFCLEQPAYHPVKKYSNNIIKRDLVYQDNLNPNQTFKEFLTNSGEQLSSIMKTSMGSRFLQKMIDQITTKDIDEIFFLLNQENNIVTSICDNYGNYFMKKMIQKCNHKQRIFLYDIVKPRFISIANDISGTHCLQSLIESIESKDEEIILKQCIVNNLLELSCNNNATHVIQKIISVIKEPNRAYINSFVLNHFLLLSKNVNGICVIKTFISFNSDEQIKLIILANLERDCYEITQDLFGNYVIQHALDSYGYYYCIKVITMICNNIVIFSNQKFSSNVVDKVIVILQKTNYPYFSQIISSLFLNQINFVELILNKYGLFVLINSLKLLGQEDKFMIKSFLLQNIVFNDTEDNNKLLKIINYCK